MSDIIHLDKVEVERLQLQNTWLNSETSNRIIWAPIKNEGLRVLDVGCADGTVTRSIQKYLVKPAKLVGADIVTTYFPKDNSDGINYVALDARKPFPAELQSGFDVVHARFLLVLCAPTPLDTVISNLVSGVAPGGWLQVIEPITETGLPGQGPAMTDLETILGALFNKLGLANLSSALQKAFVSAGLEDVKLEKMEPKVGKTVGDKGLVEDSITLNTQAIELVLTSLKNSGLDLELPDSMMDNLVQRFADETRSQGGTFYNLIVTGRKPA